MRTTWLSSWRATLLALALLVLVGSLRHSGFLSLETLINALDDGAVLGIAALGAMVVMSSGGIDLSPGAVVALASISVASLVQAGVPPTLAFAIAVLGGATLGALAGFLIDVLAMPAFIVTLGAMFLARGVALAMHVEALPIDVPSWAGWSRVELPLGLDLAALAWLALAAALALAYRHARTLRNALALGGDERTATYFGVPVRATRVRIHALGGAFAALAGVAYTLYSGKGDSTACVGLELDAIAAAVIGGTALRGGEVAVFGTVLGALLLGLLQTLLVFEGVPGAGWTRLVLGLLLLAFVALRRMLAGRTEA